MDKVSVNDGKYTVVYDEGKLSALRYDEPWRDLTGDNLVYWLAMELQEARENVEHYRAEVVRLHKEFPVGCLDKLWGNK